MIRPTPALSTGLVIVHFDDLPLAAIRERDDLVFSNLTSVERDDPNLAAGGVDQAISEHACRISLSSGERPARSQ